MKKYPALCVIIGIILLVGIQSSQAVPPRLETPLIWMGTVDTNWNNANNWQFEGETFGGVPNASTDVIIDYGKPRYPDTYTANPVCGALYVESGGLLTLSGGYDLTVYYGINIDGTLTVTHTESYIYSYQGWTNNGTFNHGNSRVNFIGTLTSEITGNHSTTFNDLYINKNTANSLIDVNVGITATNIVVIRGKFQNGPNVSVTGDFKLNASTASNASLEMSPGNKLYCNRFIVQSGIEYITGGEIHVQGDSGTVFTCSGSGSDFTPSGGAVYFEGGDVVSYTNTANTVFNYLVITSNTTLNPDSSSSTKLEAIGNIQINSGSILDMSTAVSAIGESISLQGDFINDGSFNSGDNTNAVITFTGNAYSEISGSAPVTFTNLVIEKQNNAALYPVNSDINIQKSLAIESGQLVISANSISIIDGPLNVKADSVLEIQQGGTLKLGDGVQALIESNGTFKAIGIAQTNCPKVTGINTEDRYSFVISGTIDAYCYWFDQLDGSGLVLDNNAVITDISYGKFTNPPEGGTLITYNTQGAGAISQAYGIEFTSSITDNRHNVTALDENTSHITFVNSIGNITGSDYETDPYNLIYWASSAPTLITNLTPEPNSVISNTQPLISADFNDMEDWNYRTPITITNSGAISLTDYQISIDLNNVFYDNTGLKGSWHFSEGTGTITQDSSGNSMYGTLTNGPIWTTGKFGNGLSFDGSDDYVLITPAETLSGTFTVAAWAKVYDNDVRNIFSTRYPGGWTFDMKFSGGDTIHGDIGSGGGNWITTSADASFNYQLDTWYHVVYVVTPTGYSIYVNGDQVGFGSYATSTPLLYDTNHYIQIGYHYPSAPEAFYGKIDEVKVYDRALLGTEIAEQYNALKARLDYADIRFAGDSGLCSYWLESDSKAWVKVPVITASSTANLYMYTGNISATSASNGDNTFLFFDDFSGSSIDANKWYRTETGGFYAIENGALSLSDTSTESTLESWTTISVFNNSIVVELDAATQYQSTYTWNMETWCLSSVMQIKHTNATTNGWWMGSDNSNNDYITTGKWYHMKEVFAGSGDGGTATLYVDDLQKGQASYAITTSAFSLAARLPDATGWSISHIHYDNVRVRKYAGTDLTLDIGSSQQIISTGINLAAISMTMNGSPVSFNADANGISYTPGTALSSGVYNIVVEVMNNAGDLSVTSWLFTVETTAPTGTIVIDNGAFATSSTSVSLSLSATDPESGVTSMRFSNNGIDWTEWVDYATSYPWTLIDGEGTNYVCVQYKNGAGLVSETFYDSIIYDITPPTGAVLINGGNWVTTDTNASLTLYGVDTGSGVSQMYIYNGVTSTGWINYETPYTCYLGNTLGTKTITVQYQDYAGNISQGTISDTIVLAEDHIGNDWVLNSPQEIYGIHYNIENFIIPEGITVTTKPLEILEINAQNIIITGALSADGKGYGPGQGLGVGGDDLTDGGGGGGGYGGTGGKGGGFYSSDGGVGGETYGDPLAPTEFGSGGGRGHGNVLGGAGGGVITLKAVDCITITGVVSANGAEGNDARYPQVQGGGGGGSGGSIRLTAPIIAGNSTIRANGGHGGNKSIVQSYPAGGGGGGRIEASSNILLIDSEHFTVDGGIQGLGWPGHPPAEDGEPGTVVLTTTPDAPTDLFVEAVSSSQINLKWRDNSMNELGFKIEYRLNNWGDFAEIATVDSDTTSYSTTHVLIGIPQYYRVRAFNDAGNSDYSNIASATPSGSLTYDEKVATGTALVATFRPTDYYSVTIAAIETPEPYEPTEHPDQQAPVGETTTGSLTLWYNDYTGESFQVNREVEINNLTKAISYNGNTVTDIDEIFGSLSPSPSGDFMALMTDTPYWMTFASGPIAQFQPQAIMSTAKTDPPAEREIKITVIFWENITIGDVNIKTITITGVCTNTPMSQVISSGLITPTMITPTWFYNCVGWVFTDNDGSISPLDVNTIISDNNYTTMTNTAHVGDLVVYRNAANKVTHVGIVREEKLSNVVDKFLCILTYIITPPPQYHP